MKVKVVKCITSTFWYKGYEGRVFECVDKNGRRTQDHDGFYHVWIDKNTDTRGFILKSDAEVHTSVEDDVLEIMADEYMKKCGSVNYKKDIRFDYMQGLKDMKELLTK
jgi:hypothetical protein